MQAKHELNGRGQPTAAQDFSRRRPYLRVLAHDDDTLHEGSSEDGAVLPDEDAELVRWIVKHQEVLY
jgi:hypothetical protein